MQATSSRKVTCISKILLNASSDTLVKQHPPENQPTGDKQRPGFLLAVRCRFSSQRTLVSIRANGEKCAARSNGVDDREMLVDGPSLLVIRWTVHCTDDFMRRTTARVRVSDAVSMKEIKNEFAVSSPLDDAYEMK